MADVENPDEEEEAVAAEASECSRRAVICTLGCLSVAWAFNVLRLTGMVIQLVGRHVPHGCRRLPALLPPLRNCVRCLVRRQ